MNRSPSLSLATAVAALFAAAGCGDADQPTSAEDGKSQSALVKCEGVNECKGTSECQSASNENGCQGLNDCKGQGWVSIPKEECDEKGGTVLGATASAAPSEPPVSEPQTAAAVECEGINECAGTSECAGPDNSCKGTNSCKGHGYLEVPSEAECLEQGGTVRA